MTLAADWFFTTTMRLSPRDTDAFLDTMTTLRRREITTIELRHAALALTTAGPRLQAYALGPLLAAIKNDSQAEGHPQQPDQEVLGLTDNVASSILSLTDHPLAPRLGTALSQVARDAQGTRAVLLDEIAARLADDARRHRAQVRTIPYHELGEFIMPTLTLVALAELTRRQPRTGGTHWLGDTAIPLATAALRGDFGRLALLAAADGACRADRQAREVVWQDLWRAGDGATELQPDLLAALARSWFGHPGDDGPTVDELEHEAITGEDIGLWRSHGRSDLALEEAYALVSGRVSTTPAVLSAVLWNATMWEMAAEVDPVETAHRLTRWWQTPEPPASGSVITIHTAGSGEAAVDHVRAFTRLHPRLEASFDDGPITSTTFADGSTVFSPWLHRKHDGWDHRRLHGPAFLPRTTEHLVRLFLLAPLSVRLLENIPAADGTTRNDHLISLLFHAIDVLRDDAAMLEALERGDYVDADGTSPAMATLTWHNYQLLHATGAGLTPRPRSATFADFALRMLEDDNAHDLGLHEQRARSNRQALPAVSSMWISRAWIKSSDTTSPSQWFTGDLPPARQVLFAAIDRLCEVDTHQREMKRRENRRRQQIEREHFRANADPRRKPNYGTSLDRGLRPPDLLTPAQLLREIYPQDWPDPIRDTWPQLDLDWYASRARYNKSYESALRQAGGDRSAITSNAARPERLLLSPAHPLAVWREHSDEVDSWSSVQSAPMTMRVMRLSALLSEPDLAATDPVYVEWVEDWLDRVHAVDHTEQLPLNVRSLMIGLIRARLPEAGSPSPAHLRQLASIHSATIDGILEFSTNNLKHATQLLQRLLFNLPLSGESALLLQLRAVETIYRRRRYSSELRGLRGASQMRMSEWTQKNLDQQVNQFISGLVRRRGEATVAAESLSPSERISALWEQISLASELRTTRVPLRLHDRDLTERRNRSEQLRLMVSVADRFHACEVRSLLDVSSRMSGSAHLRDLFDEQARPAGARRNIQSATVIGVVAAVQPPDLENSSQVVWLNCGTGDLLRHVPAPTAAPLVVGDIIAAQVRGTPPAVVEVSRLDRAAPGHDEVRAAIVHATAPWLRVEVDGAKGYTYPSDESAAAEIVHRHWDPDLARTFSGIAPDGPRRRLVRWDSALRHWLPVVRGLSELIVDELAAADSVALTFTSIDDGEWHFVSSPGLLYHLPPEVWTDPEALDGLLRPERHGLVLTAALADTERLLLTVRLGADGEPDHDDRNVQWLRLFDDQDDDLTVVVRQGEERVVEIQPPPGFPLTVRALGAERAGSRVHVLTQPWTDYQARRGTVPVSFVQSQGVRESESPTPQRFDELHNVRRGDILTLSHMVSKKISTHPRVATSTSLVVSVEAESLSLLDQHGTNLAKDLVHGRLAEVVNEPRADHPRAVTIVRGAALSTAALVSKVHTANTDPAVVLDDVAASAAVQGVIVRRLADGKRYGTWCRFGDAVHYVELEPEWFGDTDPKLIGQLFSGTLEGGEWTFEYVYRRITVRALFQLRDGEPDPGEDAEYIGSDHNHDYRQIVGKPVILRQDAQVSPDDVVRLLKIEGAGVQVVNQRASGAVRTVSVSSRGSDRTLLGATRTQGMLGGLSVGGAELRVTRSSASTVNGLPQVEVRRYFALRLRGETRRTSPDPGGDLWQRFVKSGKEHVLGSVAQDGTAFEVGGGLRPPGPDGVHTSRLPLEPDQEPAVGGAQYIRNAARARLVPTSRGFLASYVKAEPLTLDDFARRYSIVANGTRIVLAEPLHYIGPPTEERQHHLFEWGYGWTVAVPPERLRVPAAEDSPLPALFHGDRVDAVSYVLSEDHGDPVLVVDQFDITHHYTRRVVDEATKQHLHLIDLRVSLDVGTVHVLRAQAGRSLGDTRDPFEATQWVPFAASLDDVSRDALLDRLRAEGRTGLVQQRVLARLDTVEALSTGGRIRTFHTVRETATDLRDGDFVFLTAQRIEQTDNELTVIFGLHGADNAHDLAVRVNRREFSYRESTLSRLVAGGLDPETMKIVLLVKLLYVKRDTRFGSVRHAPTRKPETLVSYLASRNGTCYAVMGDQRLEIAPGVLFNASQVLGAEGVGSGAVVRLALDDERKVTLLTALPSDKSYLSAHDRPVIVFPKATALARVAPARDEAMGSMFTVSGLPDISASPVDGSGVSILATPHPKVCLVHLDSTGKPVLRTAPNESLRHGRVLRTDINEPAGVRPWQPIAERGGEAAELVKVAWARMSFANSTARDIAQACRRHEWIHHDRKTGHNTNGRRVGPYPVRPGTARDEGVFFSIDNGWTLRYTPKSMPHNGLPASALVEDQTFWPDGSAKFTVAAPNADNSGLWLELGPGRVVEVRGALINEENGASLANVDWSMFAAGDRVTLRLSQRSSGGLWEVGPNHLVLTSWSTSLRAALPQDRRSRLLLPVAGTNTRGGALRLGAGRHLSYPIATNDLAAYTDVDAVWLNHRNDIEPVSYEGIRPGDAGLLTVGPTGDLALAGLPDVEVRLAGDSESNWPGYRWLRQSLDHPETRRPLLTNLGGVLPVTIIIVGVDRRVVTVCRRDQRSGQWPSNRLVRTEILAQFGTRALLLRSGDAVFTVAVNDLVQGVPHALCDQVGAALVANRRTHTLWWSVDETGTPHAGLHGNDVTNPIVTAEHVVLDENGAVAGLVCMDSRSRRYHWLPVGHASWIRDISADDLLANLRRIGDLAAKKLHSGAISITTHPAVAQQAKALHPSAPLRVVVGKGDPVVAASGEWRYVARLEMPPVLLSYESAEPGLAEGDSRFTEVDSAFVGKNRTSITVRDVNTRLVRLNLPQWTLNSHEAIRGGSDAVHAPPVTKFKHYQRWYREGLPAVVGENDPTETIIRAAGTIVEQAEEPSVDVMAAIVAQWLALHGPAVANLVPDQEMDAAVALAAVVVLDFLGVHGDDSAAAAAVAILHQTGRRAAASVQAEQFVTAWIARPERHALNGAWARLRTLSLSRELTPRQVRQLRSFSQAMLVKPSLRDAERDLAPIARALMTAVGDLDTAAELVRDSEIMSPLALWGRILVAPQESATSQARLLDSQRRTLHLQADHVVSDAVPITLMPVITPPDGVEAQFLRMYTKVSVVRT
ncbi:hypothetical protein [Lentzea aerocolonigenes]|nr:hypothetical protein [Lentzea aerocolonigenes]